VAAVKRAVPGARGSGRIWDAARKVPRERLG